MIATDDMCSKLDTVTCLAYEYQPLPRNSEAASDEFRLLTLLPGQRGSRISCSLCQASLKEGPVYEALSYTWGDPKAQQSKAPSKGDVNRVYTIELSGRRARIGYNLHAALQQLRDSHRSRVLWVDALCIDQTNNDERSNQVKLMAKIYGQASGVVCWLGESDEYSDLAFDTVEELSWAIKLLVYRYVAEKVGVPLSEVTDLTIDTLMDREISDEDFKAESPFQNFQTPRMKDCLKEALSLIPIDFAAGTDPIQLALSAFGSSRSLARYVVSDHGKLSGYDTIEARTLAIKDTFDVRAYWNRLWIVQECFFAARAYILCGNRQLDFRAVHLLALVLFARSRITGNSLLWNNGDFAAIDSLMYATGGLLQAHVSRTSSTVPTLAHAMYTKAGKLCSDPHDVVYALLNMASNVVIDIDYNRPLADLYAETTKAIIVQEKNLNIICMGNETTIWSEARRELPSWAPYFKGSISSFNLINIMGSLDKQQYRGNGPVGSKLLETVTMTRSRDKVLAIEGIFWGTVKHVEHRTNPYKLTSEQLLATFKSVLDSMLSKCPDVNADHFRRTLLIDQYPDSAGRSRRMATNTDATQIFRDDIEEVMNKERKPSRFVDSLRRALTGKTVCLVGEDDHSALALPTKNIPAMICGDVQIGDLVFIARGATVPLVVRRVTDSRAIFDAEDNPVLSQRYRLIGGSYVHGIMDGEAMKALDDGEAKGETIYLI